ncbi:restriction endonuclease [Serratia liquefaciens]|uniref:restriction endonuclease n=1 Tax=Serratia liquefaciens TaxID=614 RepID=UPI002361657E|nr:restriction endonuclease [Serratia liquefaciens]
MTKLNIVQDWGGFEKFVAHIHEDGDVIVQHDQTLTGRSGATRQIDVVVKVKKGPYEYLTLIECKYWNSAVKREQIDVLWASMQDLNAAKGAFFTTKGFQKGAQKYAESKGIALYKVREMTDDEWGKPGRVIDLYIQVIQRTIRNVKPVVDGMASFNNISLPTIPLPINLALGGEYGICKVVSKHKDKFPTLEAMIEHYSQEAMACYTAKPPLINNGEECVRYFLHPINLLFNEALVIQQEEYLFKIQKINIEVGLKVNQSRIMVDRGSKLAYALAIVDCVNKKTFAVSRALNEKVAVWTPLINNNSKNLSTNTLEEESVVNGSIFAVSIKGFFPPHEIDGLTPIKWDKDAENR